MAELRRAQSTAASLGTALGVDVSGLSSSGVHLDATSSDDLLALQEALLKAERLTTLLGRAADGATPPPPPPRPPPRPQQPLAPPTRSAPPSVAAAGSALRELPPQPSAEGGHAAHISGPSDAVDPSKLKLLHRKTAAGASGGGGGGFGRAAPKRFEPVPGAHVMARFSNGEFYKARVTAMSRSESGAPVCVVKFEEDGLVLHVPVEHVRPQHGAARA